MVLPKKYRLVDKLEIEKVFKKGMVIDSNFFRIRFYPNSLFFSRFLVIISSKVSPKSVIRNKIRRRIREIVRLNILNDKPGYDLVVTVKSASLSLKYDQLKEALIKELNRIRR